VREIQLYKYILSSQGMRRFYEFISLRLPDGYLMLILPLFARAPDMLGASESGD
jgi:hypothetical protein